MILPVLTQQPSSPQAPVASRPAAEVARVRAFVEEAHVGFREIVLPGFDAPTEKPSSIDSTRGARFGVRYYSWNGIDVVADSRTGSVVAYVDHSDEDAFHDMPFGHPNLVDRVAPRRIDDAAAADLARRYHATTGSPYGIQPFSVRDRMGNRGNHLSVDFTATWRGVPYDRDYGGYMEIGRDDGGLRWYLLHALATPLPTPPATLVPQIPANTARLVALRLLARRAGVPLAENPQWPLALAIGAPATRSVKEVGIESFLDPDEAAQVARGQGMLVYSGQFVGGDPDDHTIPRLSVMVDALDGHVLSVRNWGYGRGGGDAPGPHKPVPVPTVARPWRVAVGDSDWSPPAKAALVPIAGTVPASGRLTLTDGAAAFPATYDPKASLLGIAGKAYRPGPALNDLLKRRTRVRAS